MTISDKSSLVPVNLPLQDSPSLPAVLPVKVFLPLVAKKIKHLKNVNYKKDGTFNFRKVHDNRRDSRVCGYENPFQHKKSKAPFLTSNKWRHYPH